MVFNKGDYVYSDIKGLGLILEKNETEDPIYKIKFSNETLETTKKEEYKFLSEGFINYLIKGDFEKNFSSLSYTRGEQYYLDKRISSFTISDNLFKGTVSGDSNYIIYISFSNKSEVNMECTCTYQFNCKHEVAFLLFLKNFIEKEKEELIHPKKVIQKEESKDDTIVELVNKIEQICKMEDCANYLEELDHIATSCKYYTNEDWIHYFQEIYRLKNIPKINDFIEIPFVLLQDTKTIIRGLRYDMGFFFTSIQKEIENNIKKMYSLTAYKSERIEIIRSVIEKDYIRILYLLRDLESKNALSNALLLYITPKLEVSKEHTRILIDISHIYGSSFLEYIRPYLSRCGFIDLRDFLSFSNTKDLITLEELDKINDERIFDEIGKIVKAEKSISYIIQNTQKLLDINKEKTLITLRYLLTEIERENDSIKYNLLIQENDLLRPYATYLLSLSTSYKTYSLSSAKVMNTEFSKDTKEYYDHIIKGLKIDYQFKSDEREYRKYYYLKIHDYRETMNLISVCDYNGSFEIYSDYFGSNKEHYLAIYLIQKIEEDKKERIQKEMEIFYSSKQAYLDRINDSHVEKDIEIFRNQMKKVDAPLLLPEERIRMDFTFIQMYNRYYLSIKVGSSKLFMVQNLSRFFTNFKQNEYDKYGKTYGFYHTMDNVLEPYKNILHYLMNHYSEDNYNHKYFELSKENMDELIPMMKGFVIHFADSSTDYVPTKDDSTVADYLVTLNDFDYKVQIDADYRLKILLEKDSDIDYVIISGDQNAFVLQEGEVKWIHDDYVKKELLIFSTNNENFSIRKHRETFINEVYLRKPNQFVIDQSIEKVFKESKTDINLYFDYDNKVVSLKKKFYKEQLDENDQNESKQIEIGFNDLSDMDKARAEKVESYLSSLGFVEGILKTEDKILNFLRLDFTYLKSIANVYLSESINNKKIVKFPKTQYRITYDNGMMTIFMNDSVFTKEELAEILSKLKKKKKFVLLKNNTIIDLESDEVKQFERIVDDFHMNTKDLTQGSVIPIYQALKAYSYEDEIRMDDYVKEMINDIANFKNYEVPKIELLKTLRSYQLEGVKWLSILSKYKMGGILADDMGLGKTLQMIATLKMNSLNKPSLVVCPKTLIFNWQNEFSKFDPETEVIPVYGLAPERQAIIQNINPCKRVIYITSYDSLRNDIDHYTTEFHYVILDEAQVIKNVQALKSQSVKKLKGSIKFALTGTPIENNILDLWSIFDFLLPNYFTNIDDFMDQYNHDENYIKRIIKKVSPFILRRCKKDVLTDLPDKYQRIVTVEMKESQHKIYQAYIEQAKEMLKKNGSKGTFEVLQFLTRLRQICVDPSLFIDDYQGGSAKLDYIKEEIVESIKEGHKILIFSQFVSALNELKQLLEELNISYFMLTGETKAEERINLCNTFNGEDSLEKVFLISLKAGGNGINLTGADRVIHLDPWWNVSVENQATDRAHRIGQMRNVEVIKLICENSIEQRVIELQNLKKDLFDKVISNDDSSITRLTADDLKFILS